MAKIIWSPAALDDIKNIFEYIAKDSTDRANIFIDRLIEATDRLLDFPYSGRIISEINKEESREIIYGSYRIMYEVKDELVRIASIVHSARNRKPE